MKDCYLNKKVNTLKGKRINKNLEIVGVLEKGKLIKKMCKFFLEGITFPNWKQHYKNKFFLCNKVPKELYTFFNL